MEAAFPPHVSVFVFSGHMQTQALEEDAASPPRVSLRQFLVLFFFCRAQAPYVSAFDFCFKGTRD